MKRLAFLLVVLVAGAAIARPCRYLRRHYCDGATSQTGGPLARYLSPTGSTVSMSGVTFSRNSAATCTDASGNVTKLAANVACLAGGYHARPQISNLLSYSEDFSNAAWTKSSASVTVNSTTSPDGTTDADTLTASASGGYLYQAFSSTGGAASIEVYAKASSSQGYAVQVYDATGATSLASVSCTATTSWPASPAARCIAAVASTTSGHSIQFRIYPGGTAGTGSIFAWGAQAEWSAFADDYCPSASTPGTCAAEVATVATPPGMSTTEGCARVCATPTWTGNNPSASPVDFLFAGSTSDILLYEDTAASVVRAYDGTHAPGVNAGFTAGSRACFVTRWSASGGSLRIDNITSSTMGTATAFTAFPAFASTLAIGGDGSAKQPLGAILDSVVFGSSSQGCN